MQGTGVKGFRVWGLGFRDQGLGNLRIGGFGFEVLGGGLGFRVWGVGLGVKL